MFAIPRTLNVHGTGMSQETPCTSLGWLDFSSVSFLPRIDDPVFSLGDVEIGLALDE
mgnify:CR=1 FL=1